MGYGLLIPSAMEHEEEVHILIRDMGSGTQRGHGQAGVRKREKEAEMV